MLPVFFIVLASAALVVALVALFMSLRASLAGPSDDASWVNAGPDRGALEDEKNALLRALKDLEYEHEVGKIDDEDYARLERAYRARAKDVLGELDRDLRPYLSRAEELASGIDTPLYRMAGKKGKKKKKDVEPAAKTEAVVEAVEARTEPEPEAEHAIEKAPPVCPKCATVNDADAAFCKKCATPLAEVAS